MTLRSLVLMIPAMFVLSSGCANPSGIQEEATPERANPFQQDQSNHSKEDSAYQNPDGVEVEVDLEGDVEASESDALRAPATLAQFAQTYLRNRQEFYVQSVSEATRSTTQTEWRVDGTWISAGEANHIERSKLTHFRIRGISAVLLKDKAAGVRQGDTFTAQVPLRPFSLYQEAGSACADINGHVSLDQGVYWYLWNPGKSGCNAPVQNLSVLVSKLAPSPATTYPEYDQLIKDGKVTAVMLFGQVEDGNLEDDDPGMVQFNTMAGWLRDSGFVEIPDAPVGLRFRRRAGAVDLEVDLYSPSDFAGLGDTANLLNFDTAVTEHEIVIYQGHSLLGASNLWGTQRYPASYQIFLYGGCLGYEYYVSPILKAKGGWGGLDVVSSVTPVPAHDEPGAAFLAKFTWSLEHGYSAAWRDLLGAIRSRLGNSTFGVSGVRDNCFSPAGSTCEGLVSPPTAMRFEQATAAEIPDGDATGLVSSVSVPESLVAKSITIELDVSHESVSDLTFTLEHNGASVAFWQQAAEGDTIHEGFTLEAFKGQDAQGNGSCVPWTLMRCSLGASTAGLLSWNVEVTSCSESSNSRF